MLVIPSVDILGGRCVQLVGGRPETKKEYGDPVRVAMEWVSQGAPYLHVIDLDAAMGRGENFKKIAEILANVDVGVEVGGGIRSLDRANEILGIGADRVILGTLAMRKPDVIRELVRMAGGSRVAVALDARGGKIVVEGWRTRTDRDVVTAAKEFATMGVGAVLFTNVDVEGRMAGVAPDAIRRLTRAIDIPVIASGGVGSLEDIRAAKEAGAWGVVVGMALYEGKFKLKEAMEVAR